MSVRRLRLYGVGMGKTGTHSLSAVFEREYQAAHEAEAKTLIEFLFEHWAGARSRAELREYLMERDDRLQLEVDVSLVNASVVTDLMEIFPDGRFVLTVRDPKAWLDSMANHSLAHATPDHWVRWRDRRFRAAELSHPPEEAAWQERGLYTIDGYLSAWARHNRMVLEAVPPDRLLVIRTEDLAARLTVLADFSGVPVETLDADRAHTFPAMGHFQALNDLDPDYVDDRINHHCAAVLEQLRFQDP